ncbi:MAG: signal recognition particle-docking protein FtsY [Potamolinea sp.]
MVFNWFRRQFGTSDASSEQLSSENPQVEEEQEATEPQSVELEAPESIQEQSSATTDDYLLWAKAAYKNIKTQQQSAPEPAESTLLESAPETEPTAEAPEDAATSTATVATTTVESEEVSETTEPAKVATQEESAPIESLVTKPEEATIPVEEPATVQLAEPTVETTIAEAAPDLAIAEAQEDPAATVTIDEDQTAAPVLEESPTVEAETVAPAAVEAEEASTAPLPLWARQAADRQARLERLKATAIEVPEAEPVRAAVQQEEALEEVPGLAFDEGFVWSASVLAAQGRRPDDVSIEEISWLVRLRQGLSKTRRSLINQLRAIVGQGPLNQDAVSEIEALLLQADVGVEATDYIIKTLQEKLREEALPPEQAIAYLKKIIRDLLDSPYQEAYSSSFVPEKDTLNIWLITGVNGAGKTTTIGKLAHLAKKSDYSCLIGAADTFRAAAVEQVKVWGERSSTEVIANPGKNTDPAAVVFDAIVAAKARNIELLLVDTAGRLQNKKNLMDELAKIRRIVDKKAPDARVESLLVLDATLGQNGLRQAQVFSEAAKLSGVVLTKLDGTAKGGVALAVVQELGLPIRFIGAGEGIEDLRPFSSYEFVEALLSS